MSDPFDQLNVRRIFIYWKNTGLLDSSPDQARLARYFQDLTEHLKNISSVIPTDVEVAEVALPIVKRLTDMDIWVPIPELYKTLIEWTDNVFYKSKLDLHMYEFWKGDIIAGFVGYIAARHKKEESNGA